MHSAVYLGVGRSPLTFGVSWANADVEWLMIVIPRNATNERVMEVVFHWVDVLAEGQFDRVAYALGYAFAGTWLPVECIRSAIANYRSPDFYPGIEGFSVTRWREARGRNYEPRREIIWYAKNSSNLAGAISVDLPLNGKWSDLCADFVLFSSEQPPDAGYVLKLEEIYSWRQRAQESAAVED